MGFLQRVRAVVQKNINVQNNSEENYSFEDGFTSNALKKKKFSYSDFMQKSPYSAILHENLSQEALNEVSLPTVYDDELALNSPARFILRYVNSAVIQNAIDTNPNIKKILTENGLEISFNISNVTSIMMSHLIPTANTARKIYIKMGHKKEEINYIRLTQAALLHDIGKVFIPAEILNKRGRLTAFERSIVELHNVLSYEILKTTGLNPLVARLALEHHDYDRKLVRTQENQALTIADVYCALRELRPYKKPINDIGAKTILYDMGTNGKLDSRYISYLN